MRIVRIFFCAIAVVGQLQVLIAPAYAVSSPALVISQVYPGATGLATQEFVELHNNSAYAIDITDWCISYISSAGTKTTKLGCFTVPDQSIRLWVKTGGYATFATSEYQSAQHVSVDVTFSSTISADGGHVKLVDSQGNEIDRVGWGTAINPETTAASGVASTIPKSLQRRQTGSVYQDTDNNATDFQVMAPPIFHVSDLYEVVTYVDVCPNIDGTQATVPSGYLGDQNGDCQVDSCLNITGLQISVPDHYDADTNGVCTAHDECDNMVGIQVNVPQNMIHIDANDCTWNVLPLVLSELLPNAVGTDAGNEFVEIYNPTNETIDLSLYSIKTGVGSDKTYAFPFGATIAPGEHRTFSDSVMKFTLVNTTGRVMLTAIDGTTLGDSGVYDSPPEGESWALIGGTWQYTNRPTPNAMNQASLAQDKVSDASDTTIIPPCPTGKYRNPLTGRCRLIVSDAAMLANCDVDQYRNPESGRCRKIITTNLVPCKDGQYRSEETNRCRNITASTTRKPCKDNQYRSEETGRCRNLSVSNVPDAAFAVQPVKDDGSVFVGWWSLGGIALIAGGYGVWEWRRELLKFWQRIIK